MNPRVRVTMLLLLAASALGCAPASSTGSRPTPTQVRCLGDSPPGAPAAGPRPLFFLFCMQSP